jgi:hypothetical protein
MLDILSPHTRSCISLALLLLSLGLPLRAWKDHGDEQASPRLRPEAARRALLRMVQRPGEDALGLLRSSRPHWQRERIEVLGPGRMRLGPFECDLEEKWFVASLFFPRAHRHQLNQYSGVFRQLSDGRWRATINRQSSLSGR